jgi:hypothetical protein
MRAAIHADSHRRGERRIVTIRVGDFIIADLSPSPKAGEFHQKFACLAQNRSTIMELVRQAESPFDDWFENGDPFDVNDFDGSNP